MTFIGPISNNIVLCQYRTRVVTLQLVKLIKNMPLKRHGKVFARPSIMIQVWFSRLSLSRFQPSRYRWGVGRGCVCVCTLDFRINSGSGTLCSNISSLTVFLTVFRIYLCCCRLIVLLLIRRSITSLRRNLQRVTDRLPIYHDDDMMSTNSATTPAKDGAPPGQAGPDGVGAPAANGAKPPTEVVLWTDLKQKELKQKS